MKLYAEVTGVRVRQILMDAVLLLWVTVWIRIGMRVHDLVNALAGPGERLEDAGGSFAGSASSLGGRADDLPLIGDRLGDAFGRVAQGGRALERAGVAQQDAVHTLALWLGVLLAIIPIIWALVRYLPGRVRWVREATAAARLRTSAADLRLFALRALVTVPLSELHKVSADPAGDYDAGRFRDLAAVELASMGLLA
jgi:hypothetical protein